MMTSSPDEKVRAAALAGQVLDPPPKPPLAKPNLVFNHVDYACVVY